MSASMIHVGNNIDQMNDHLRRLLAKLRARKRRVGTPPQGSGGGLPAIVGDPMLLFRILNGPFTDLAGGAGPTGQGDG